ncbi:hypothetical protein ABT116_08515 [Streptomyces sp. NPDC002130]|uniref:hypothetical protein n=1 Tax=Streptomyces sp. NPDC002130 TaxID=3155568 RepID=UPI00331D1162
MAFSDVLGMLDDWFDDAIDWVSERIEEMLVATFTALGSAAAWVVNAVGRYFKSVLDWLFGFSWVRNGAKKLILWLKGDEATAFNLSEYQIQELKTLDQLKSMPPTAKRTVTLTETERQAFSQTGLNAGKLYVVDHH